MKVYVCYLTTGRYSDTSWVLARVFADDDKGGKGEDKAKHWKETKVKAFLEKAEETNLKPYSYDTERAEKLGEEIGLGPVHGDWEDDMVADYQEMEVL